MEATFLVTGGCGFIGTWVLRSLLRRGFRVLVLDPLASPPRWQTVLGDNVPKIVRTDASLTSVDELHDAIRSHNVTHIIHLAALLTPACQADPWLGCQVNIAGSMAVFEAARRSRTVRSIATASSFAVYGPETGSMASTNRPPSFYGAFKQSVDLIAEQYWRHFQLRSIAIRPHVVYGPEREIGLTAAPSLACRAAARGEPCVIGYRGLVGYDYVEDVAEAFVRGCLEGPEGALVADLPGERVTSEEFADVLAAVVPESRGRVTVEGPDIPMNVPPDPNYIRNVFPDWNPTSLREGIRRTVDFYRSGTSDSSSAAAR